MIGPGKYDHLLSKARADAEAAGAVLIIIEGVLGSGFSCQGPPELVGRLPEILRGMAAQIEADTQ